MRAAAALVVLAVLLLPRAAAAVMPEGGGEPAPGAGVLRALTPEELRALAIERARETPVPSAAAPAVEPAPVSRPALRPASRADGSGSLLLIAFAALAAAGVLGAIAVLRARALRAGAVSGGRAPDPDGSPEESLWRMHLRRRR